MKNYLVLILICIVAGMASAADTSNKLPASYDCGAVVAAVVKLHDDANKKYFNQENPDKENLEFDAREYFTVLKHISPPEGYVLDYVYEIVGMGNRPYLYLRKSADPRFETFKDYEESVGGSKGVSEQQKKLSSMFQLDGTPESFFEAVVFEILKGQFYLTWHANYNDKEIVISKKDVKRIVAELSITDFGKRISASEKKQALKLDVTPTIAFLDEDTAEVSVVTFSKWSGFSRKTWKISRKDPRNFSEPDIKTLLEYKCGVMF